MILTGNAIQRAMIYKNIDIQPFDVAQLGVNSYDLRLDSILKVYTKPKDCPLDLKTISKEQLTSITIPESGYMLKPDELYLGSTVEHTFTDMYVPLIETRSSLARAGLSSHVSAGFGDIGFNGKWTLEITVIRPLIVYPNIRVAQIYYLKPEGLIEHKYKGRYQNQSEVTQSKFDTNQKGVV